MKQHRYPNCHWTMLLLTAWVFVGLSIIPCPAGITEGMTRAEVIERWGFPRAQLTQGNREYLDYDDEREVELRNGIVYRVEGAIILPPPTPEVEASVSMPEPEPFEFDPESFSAEWELEIDEATGGILVPILMLFLIVFMISTSWKIYRKANRPGWASLVPIYNMIVLIEIAGKPNWWFLLLFIPVVQVIIGILIAIALAERFGKSAAFGVGLVFLPLIFYPILAFGNARYNG